MMADKCISKCLRSSNIHGLAERFLTGKSDQLLPGGRANDVRVDRHSIKTARRLSGLSQEGDMRIKAQGPSNTSVSAKANQFHTLSLDDVQSTGCKRAQKERNLINTIIETVAIAKNKVCFLRKYRPKVSSLNNDATVKPYESIPGPKGLPFLGSALEYTILGKYSPKEYDKALKDRHNRYGPIFREKILKEEFVYISDPNDVRLLAQNEGSAPLRPNLEAMVKSRQQQGLPVGITAMQGKEWLKNRKSINPAISLPSEVKKFSHAQRIVAKDMISYIKKLQGKTTQEVPNFEQVLICWALESIAVALLDTRLGLLHPTQDKNPAAEGLRHCMDIFFDYGARLTFGLPLWKLFNTKDWKIFCKSQKDEFEFAGYFVEKKLKELKSKNINDSPSAPTGCPFHHDTTKKSQNTSNGFSCLLDHVINYSDLSKEEAVTVCLELLAGGIDTTSTAAVFTLYQLSLNPKHQEHLRKLLEEERDQDMVDYEREKSKFSQYLKACVWEAIRLNPLTYANMRTTEKDLVFSGYSVPAGTVVRFTSHLMNLDNEEYFLDADKFIPERWLDRNSPYRCSKQFTFTPFGHGARQCPGRRLAEQELDLLFRELLANFKVGYKYEKIGTKVRLFNCADKPAKFHFSPL